MSANAVDALAPVPTPDRSRPPDWDGDGRVRPVAAAGALGAAALVALSIHHFVPPGQQTPMTWMDSLPAWQHPYPAALGALLAVAVAWAGGQFASSPLRRWSLHYAPLLAGGVALACVWELLTVKGGALPYPYFPGPDEVLGALIEDRYVLLESTWHSLRLLFAGYLAGVVSGLVLGVLIGWFPAVRYWVMPALKIAGPIPATALVALAMTLFPASLTFFSGSLLIGYAVLFPMTTLTSSGISNVRLSYLDVARTLGGGRLYLVFRVALPAALPNIFLGLFVGLLTSFLTLIVAETVGVKAGLGWYIQWQKGYAEYGKVYAALAIMAVVFSTLLTLLFKLRDRVLSWQKGVIKW